MTKNKATYIKVYNYLNHNHMEAIRIIMMNDPTREIAFQLEWSKWKEHVISQKPNLWYSRKNERTTRLLLYECTTIKVRMKWAKRRSNRRSRVKSMTNPSLPFKMFQYTKKKRVEKWTQLNKALLFHCHNSQMAKSSILKIMLYGQEIKVFLHSNWSREPERIH